MDFIPFPIQKYSEGHTEPESALLQKVNRETHLHVLRPRMLSGHLQGRFLSMVSHMVKPDYILEIGTYTGYSALCMAEGLSEKGQLVTLEVSEEVAARAQHYFDESPLGSRIKLMRGDASELIPTLNQPWDLVFIDADKESYLKYYELVVPNVRQGGFILMDNVLWSGKVVDEKETDAATETIREFNNFVHRDDRVENILVPIRDGLMVVRKR